ncbi:ArsR family transcriptional regulator [Macrococcus brunensis]|uniref:ArsR family transcriptional regulator n=1 Tax=Macrococcus brunensis TaxID=198483 RepID=A0A4R6BBN3_9STAP|nr:metalloregulator ArsR/SmtB family transcription factor [Macrococcus brunensis]TDL95241.1 ArsR family transcriptional regulator [Macrococcus brunensis]ULG74482.1 metalloregulator ArsR/SmtB family transcription factor [Macrococcus brunensis]
MNYEETAKLMKTISDPSRLEIIDMLSCGELCACDILTHFTFSQPTLSHHMKVLEQQSVVSKRKEGTKTMYQLNYTVLEALQSQFMLITSPTDTCVCRTEAGATA